MTAILGAGLSGLSAGYYLLRKGLPQPTVIYEAGSRIGGWIKTDRFDGFVFESGPRTIRPKGPAAQNTLDLIDELGLSEAVYPIHSNHVAARNRMIYAKGKLNMLPSDLSGVIKTVPPFTKPLAVAGLKDLFTGRSAEPLEDETMYSFVERRFGKEIADYAVSSMLCGICAGDAKQISVKFLMKSLFETEQKHGGVLRGLLKESLSKKGKTGAVTGPPGELAKKAKQENWSIYSIQGGLQALPNRIGNILNEYQTEIKLGVKCEEIEFGDGKIQLRVDGDERTVDRLVSSIPSYKLARYVGKQHPVLARELSAIPFVDVAVINLHYRRPNLQKQQGFGFLVPPIENLPILGVIFDSCCFDMDDNTVLTVMMGGAWFEKWFGDDPSEEKLLDVALKHVNQILDIEQQPDTYKVNLLRRCIPQYVVGHHRRVEGIKEYIREHGLPLGLCGSSYDGVGVNDVILSARVCVDELLGGGR